MNRPEETVLDALEFSTSVPAAIWEAERLPGALAALDELVAERDQLREEARLHSEIADAYFFEKEAAEAERDRYKQALEEIAGPSPRSYRPEVEQLRDAVKWRQGIARDALARADLDGKEPR